MAAAGPALFAGGTALQIYSQRKQAEQQAQQMEAEAAIRYEQAQELMRVGEFNIDLMRREKFTVMADQVGSFAKGGVDVSSGTTLSTLYDTANKVTSQIIERQRRTELEASLLISGARSFEESAAEINRNKNLQSFGTAFGAAGSYFMTRTPNTSRFDSPNTPAAQANANNFRDNATGNKIYKVNDNG